MKIHVANNKARAQSQKWKLSGIPELVDKEIFNDVELLISAETIKQKARGCTEGVEGGGDELWRSRLLGV